MYFPAFSVCSPAAFIVFCVPVLRFAVSAHKPTMPTGLEELEHEANLLAKMYRPVKSLPAKLERSVSDLENCLTISQKVYQKDHFLRCTKLALMHERNIYLKKLRLLEEYGRRNNWGVAHSKHPNGVDPEMQKGLPGAALLHAVYNVLYKSSE